MIKCYDQGGMLWYDCYMNDETIYITIAVIALIIIDYISGVLAAAYNGELSSRRMKEGLLKKLVYILIMLTCYIIDFTSHRVDLGFTISLYVAVGVGIVLIEITSIFENCCKINPDITNSNILDIINKNHKDSKDK